MQQGPGGGRVCLRSDVQNAAPFWPNGLVVISNRATDLTCKCILSMGLLSFISSADWEVAWQALCFYVVYYSLARPLVDWLYARKKPALGEAEWQRKRITARSWLLTIPTALYLTLAGWQPFVQALSTWAIAAIDFQREDAASRAAAVVFVVFCCLDLLMGTVDYRSAIDPINGYVHHIVSMTGANVSSQQRILWAVNWTDMPCSC